MEAKPFIALFEETPVAIKSKDLDGETQQATVDPPDYERDWE